jgi:hypothetical protein
MHTRPARAAGEEVAQLHLPRRTNTGTSAPSCKKLHHCQSEEQTCSTARTACGASTGRRNVHTSSIPAGRWQTTTPSRLNSLTMQSEFQECRTTRKRTPRRVKAAPSDVRLSKLELASSGDAPSLSVIAAFGILSDRPESNMVLKPWIKSGRSRSSCSRLVRPLWPTLPPAWHQPPTPPTIAYSSITCRACTCKTHQQAAHPANAPPHP